MVLFDEYSIRGMELIDIKGVGQATLEKLNNLGIVTMDNLVDFLPSDYIDISRVSTYDEIIDGEYIMLSVCVLSITSNSRGYGRASYVRAKADCDGNEIVLIWFNAPYILHTLETGETLVHGQIKYVDGKYTMINPTLSKINDAQNVQGIKAVYPTHGIISDSVLSKIIKEALRSYRAQCFVEGVFDLDKAYRDIHAPKSAEDIEKGRETLCLYDIVKDLVAYRAVREEREGKTTSDYRYPMAEEVSLPYPLTASQKSTLNDIIDDMRLDKCMNRLVLGDVGSGKTVVAILAMCAIAVQGEQSVLLAPTEILCRQHYNTAQKLLSCFGYRIAMLSSDIDSNKRREILDRLASGSVDMLFSTHACLSEKVSFARLKLGIIDEVHKFGVAEKSALVGKGAGVNLLALSATPVPRSLAMNIYGDLDISRLEKRAGVKNNIKTYIFASQKLESMYSYIGKLSAQGEKCFVVCPRLKGSDKEDIYSCVNMYTLLKSKYVCEDKIGIVYGSMSDDNKDSVMGAFRSGAINVLVATTVVEVGVDIPDARHMFIIGADCHGLATLHQLRGRIGRDGKDSECFLHVRGARVPKRIEVMKDCSDGIKLAVVDAGERGYGDIIGMRQAGRSNYDRYHVKVTIDMVMRAKSIADLIDLDSVNADNIIREIVKASCTVLN